MIQINQTNIHEYNRQRAIEFGIQMVEKERQAKLAKERALGRVSYVNMYIAPRNGENERIKRSYARRVA